MVKRRKLRNEKSETVDLTDEKTEEGRVKEIIDERYQPSSE